MQLPGWHWHVKQLYSRARNTFIKLVNAGKSVNDECYESMKKSRAAFKKALKTSTSNYDQCKADQMAKQKVFLVNLTFELK